MRQLRGSRRHGKRERGQILVLFELITIVILGFAAMVVDLGVLRNNRQILVNTLDAAALAGGTQLPVNGASAAGAANTLINANIHQNYPSLPASGTAATARCVVGADPNISACGYQIKYFCMIGADDTSGAALIYRDVPSTCDPRPSLLGGIAGSPLSAADLAALPAYFNLGAGKTRYSSCDPAHSDKCNVVQIAGSLTMQYVLAPVVGINSGSTGTVVSVACAGPCGKGTTITPVDLVVIIDRTASMDTHSGAVQATRDAAKAILGVYDPAKQRVALGLLGPSSTRTCNGSGGPLVQTVAQTTQLNAPAIAGSTTADVQSAKNVTGGASTLQINTPTSTANGDLLVAGITFDGGSNTTTISPPAGWTLIKRTNNSTNVGVASYYLVAGPSEPTSYTWNFSNLSGPLTVRASGGILRYTDANPSSPINQWSSNTGNGTSVTASGVTTTTGQTAIVDFYGTDTGTTFTAPGGTTERFDVRNTNALGPSSQGATSTQTNAGATGNDTATAAAGAQWAAQLIAINAIPLDTSYSTNTANYGQWIPIGFTGTDPISPAPTYNEAYSDTSGGVKPYPLVDSSHIVSAINCFDSGYYGTNLATPMAMATYYLQHFGRPHVTWGILLETDGYPQYMNTGDPSNYMCATASTNAWTAKATTNADGTPIQIFTVGFGLDSFSATCPDATTPTDSHGTSWHNKSVNTLLASMATQPSVDGGCPGTSNTDGDHYFCEPYDAQLAGIFEVIAEALQTTKSHLVQLYPTPVVLSVGSGSISGEYFTGAFQVTFGGTPLPPASWTFVSDTSITFTPPTGSGTVPVVVTTGGGSSYVTGSGQYYTYP